MADQLQRGDLSSLSTSHRFTAAMLAYTRQQTAQYYQIMVAMNEKPTPSLKEAIQRAVIPWQAPPLTPEERGKAFLGSSLMGRHLVLEDGFLAKMRSEYAKERRQRGTGEQERSR